MKNINLRINKDSEVIVSCNKNTSKDRIEKMILANKEFIEKAVENTNKRRKEFKKYKENLEGKIKYLSKVYEVEFKDLDDSYNYIINEDDNNIIFNENKIIEDKSNFIDKFYDEKCEIIFNDSLNRMYKLIENVNIKYPNLEYKYAKSTWGKCYVNKNKIVLNKHLIKTDVDLIDYVVLHELVHFKYIYHDKNFYDLLYKLMPDAKNRRKKLNEEYYFDVRT